MTAGIAENIRRLLADPLISSRYPDKLRLIAVSKKKSLELMKEAVVSGIHDLGENRIQEAENKLSREPFTGIEKHFIGTIQSNKARKMLQYFDWFHGLFTLKVAKIIDREASPIKCLIQVNTSGEESKSGLYPEQMREFVRSIQPLKHLQVRGLMTIGPLTEDREAVRRAFRLLFELHQDAKKLESEHIRFDELSMGMSGDWRIALEEGSSMLRIGTAIFGARE